LDFSRNSHASDTLQYRQGMKNIIKNPTSWTSPPRRLLLTWI
jgi:hypothetical protein